MQREATVLFVCLLILFADILSIRQTIDFWLNEQILLNQFSVITILSALGIFAVLLVWINYALIRKIINRQLSW